MGADRYCYGSLPGREEIVVQPGQAPLDAIARHYLIFSMCPRFMGQDEMRGRKKYLADLVKEYKAEGRFPYKYGVGEYDTREAAQRKLAEVRKVFPGAFVVSCKGTQIVK